MLSERDAGTSPIDRPPRRAVLLLSSGDGRRIGPQRAWVAWARHRAALGDLTLRLDVAGVGDSTAALEAQQRRQQDERVIDDVRRAVAWLRREHGVRECTIVGAGPVATQAWRAALAGVDVQHVVAIAPVNLRGMAGERPARGGPAAGLTLSLAGVSQERALALVRREMGRAGLALVRDRRVSVHQLVLADPAFAGPAGRDELCRRLDALLPPNGESAVSVDFAPRHNVARARA